MTNNALHTRGGSESYLEVAATELRRLGHEVVFFSATCGDFADRLREDGYAVHDTVDNLPDRIDVIHGQHTNATALVRTRFPRVPLVFVTHSWLISIEDPVPELGAAAYICFNQLTEDRLRAGTATVGAPIHRLTQPVEVSYADGARRSVGETPMRAVVVSRRVRSLASRLEVACEAHGIAFDWFGRPDRHVADPRAEMMAADIVFAAGRTALEAMAAGRAVLVIDESTYGGWITDESYPRLEADGFTGLLDAKLAPPLEGLLSEYSPALGATARRLAVTHHEAHRHAVDLVEIYSSIANTTRVATSPDSIALLAHERYKFEARAVHAEWRAADLRRQLDELRDQHKRQHEKVARLRGRVRNLRAKLAAADESDDA